MRVRQFVNGRGEQYEAHERTFRALEDVTPEDDDGGITVVADWVIEWFRSTGERPSSRAVPRPFGSRF